jgi:asparagine N-glycosylation enzyme membrane subunit Stt3
MNGTLTRLPIYIIISSFSFLIVGYIAIFLLNEDITTTVIMTSVVSGVLVGIIFFLMQGNVNSSF